jgi:hypothetical protein
VVSGGNVLDHCFREFRLSALRLEALPAYSVREEGESIAAWRARRPAPERSVRNDQYLREVAEDVLAGRQRQRVRIVDEPLSAYARWELERYAENQAAGEEIRVAVRLGGSRAAADDLAGAVDGWGFDLGEEDEQVVLMYYEPGGSFGSAHLATVVDLRAWRRTLEKAWRRSVPLNEYVVTRRRRVAVA